MTPFSTAVMTIAVASALLACAQSSPEIEARPTADTAAPAKRPALTLISGSLEADCADIGARSTVCVSGDGRYVAFLGVSKERQPGRETDNVIFVHDVEAKSARQVTPELGGRLLSPHDEGRMRMSADGSWLVFMTDSLGTMSSDQPRRASIVAYAWQEDIVLPLDVHRFGIDPGMVPVTFDTSDDVNCVVVQCRVPMQAESTCVVIDRQHDLAQTLGTGRDCPVLHPSISGDGRFVAFLQEESCDEQRDTPNVPSLWLSDRSRHSQERFPLDEMVRVAFSGNPLVHLAGASLSQTGRMILLSGTPSTGLDHWPVLLLCDRYTSSLRIVSRGFDGQPANRPTLRARSSEQGTAVAFCSDASNLVVDDANGAIDVFRYDWTTNRTECISTNTAGTTGNGPSAAFDMSDDGTVIAFTSRASDLVFNDDNGVPDVFLWQR